MIRMYITSENGEGMVNTMEFEDWDEIKVYTNNIGKDCELTFEVLKDK